MEKFYRVALGMVPGIGNIIARGIIDATGNARDVFDLDKSQLLKLPNVGSLIADRILDKSVLEKAKREFEYIRENNIHCIFLGDDNYPEYLSHCQDAPYIIYYRGEFDLKEKKVLSVVGTRRPSVGGLESCKRLISDLAERFPDLVVVSGLAYGIDHCAHKTALDCGLKTLAVLGHGLKFLYPALHRNIASEIESSGALLTDFSSHEKPEKNNFIKRNRIIAGLSRATVVVESGHRGGALVTADLANSYNREVFAFPGRVSDPYSAGCNRLIKTNRAVLIESYKDIEYILGWEPAVNKKPEVKRGFFKDLGPEHGKILKLLETEGDSSIDLISFKTGLPVSLVSGILLELELSGLVLVLPGDCFRKIG